jgi:hypothetical protein
MQKQHISIRLRPDNFYSVDISWDQYSGGHCQLFRLIEDALLFIERHQAKKIKRLLKDKIRQYNFNKADFNFWH